MKTLIYLAMVGIGIILSYPLTIIVVAWQQALQSAHEISEYLKTNH